MAININKLREVAINSLHESYKVHENLGMAGEEIINKNQFGDTAVKADIECEKIVINYLKKQKVPIRIISEEHGTTDLCDEPIYLGILDGIDGSKVYKENRGKGRYGTMLGIFNNLDPIYNDYIFGGIMEHFTNRLFYSMKDQGCFVIENNKDKKIEVSNCSNLDSNTRIYADTNFDLALNSTFIKDTYISKLGEYKITGCDSTATHYIDLATGKVDLVLECTRKGNLEMAIGYGFIKEAGGVMMGDEGEDIGNKKYLEYAQDRHAANISAATIKLVRELINKIK
jgi:myo-inositol-1(or 4)-monophosphatase